MVAFLKKQWFFVGMVVMVLMAFGLPDWANSYGNTKSSRWASFWPF